MREERKERKKKNRISSRPGIRGWKRRHFPIDITGGEEERKGVITFMKTDDEKKEEQVTVAQPPGGCGKRARSSQLRWGKRSSGCSVTATEGDQLHSNARGERYVFLVRGERSARCHQKKKKKEKKKKNFLFAGEGN